MKCMYCGCLESKVIDSRATDEGRTIRRRRECIQCGKRFTTYETIETTPVLVIKTTRARGRHIACPNPKCRYTRDLSEDQA